MTKVRSGWVCAMPGRVALAIGAAVLAAGCGWFGQMRGETQGIAGARAGACAFAVNDASAWVNRMPGPQRTDARPLIVSAVMTDVGMKAVLEESDASTARTLVLEVVESEAAPIPGRLAWRGAVPATMYERVEIRCGGDVLRVIEEVERVY